MNNLKKYNLKRNFDKTKEPKGKKEKSTKKLRFVVQHHLATRDHYDLRLEWNGLLKSWAVPKGPSYDTKEKRLAVQVEDHPIKYRNFEGIIPKGEYGAGPVMIWDEGYWEPIEEISKNFNEKSIKFTLKGKRLKGAWTLINFKEKNWLLIKERDNEKGFKDIKKLNKSIRTARTMKEIEENKKNTKIEITNPNKIIFNKPKITKKDIFDYYDKVSERMLPFLKNRIISTIRCPDGHSGDKFFKKHLENINEDLGVVKINSNSSDKNDYYYIKNKDGLLGEVQMNSFEFHIWGSKAINLNKPDIMVFDLDPDENLSLNALRKGVKDLKSLLDDFSLTSFLKTSGGKGYHVVVPIKVNSWKKFRKIAKDIASLMESKWPDKYISNMRKSKRKNKIFIDWVRNTKGSTSVAPYSIRIRDGAPVSMPIRWSELDKVKPDEIKMKDAIKRLRRKDPWNEFFKIKQ